MYVPLVCMYVCMYVCTIGSRYTNIPKVSGSATVHRYTLLGSGEVFDGITNY